MKKKVLGLIPARYASTRFPGKPLVNIKGKSMIQRVVEQTSKTKYLDEIIVATDNERIYEHVQSFGGKAQMTATTHQSGTDRCAEVALAKADYDIIVNIQGDEPFIQPSQIDDLIQILVQNEACQIATLAMKIEQESDFLNPNIVKVAFNKSQKALYFSRSPIPFARNLNTPFSTAFAYKHIGLYAYRRKTLLEIAELKPSILERIESLEQLRWLDNGYSIAVGLTDIETVGIDTPEDLEKIVKE